LRIHIFLLYSKHKKKQPDWLRFLNLFRSRKYNFQTRKRRRVNEYTCACSASHPCTGFEASAPSRLFAFLLIFATVNAMSLNPAPILRDTPARDASPAMGWPIRPRISRDSAEDHVAIPSFVSSQVKIEAGF